jgi:hypothetical protein
MQLRARSVVVAMAAALLLGACTPGADDPPSASAPSAAGTASGAGATKTSAPVAKTQQPDGATTIAEGDTPEALAVAVSRQLFESAPVVVVATTGSDLVAASEQARKRGAPLLLVAAAQPAPTSATGSAATASPAPSATPTPDKATEAVRAEIERLKPRAVLATDQAAATALGELPGVRVVTNEGELPDTATPPAADGLTVLVRADGKAATQAGGAAAGATAQAAGARAVAVRGADPRADPKAIEALADAPPKHLLAAGKEFGPAERLTARVAVAATGVQLPGGGQVFFPGRRLVAMYGHPSTPGLGVLGEQGLSASIKRARGLAADYDDLSDVPVIPAFEIIATVAHGNPGKDGNYSGESSVKDLEPWVKKAHEAGMYVVLDLQPGRSDFLSQAKLYEALLKYPYVGLALDSEWRLEGDQRPLGQIGGVDAAEVNKVVDWLADLTAEHKLPQKLLVLHQFRLSMLRDERKINTRRDELAVLIHMDGQGSPSLKDATWRTILPAAPKGVHWGWKNFYDEDHPMLTPKQTMRKRPQPLMISYQ